MKTIHYLINRFITPRKSFSQGWKEGYAWARKHYDEKTCAMKTPIGFALGRNVYWFGFDEGARTYRFETRVKESDYA